MKTKSNTPVLDSVLARYPETIPSPVMTAALARHSKEENERQQSEALEYLKEADEILHSQVAELRRARAVASRAQRMVVRTDNAARTLIETGDIAGFRKTVFSPLD
jgi:hypothetical protein